MTILYIDCVIFYQLVKNIIPLSITYLFACCVRLRRWLKIRAGDLVAVCFFLLPWDGRLRRWIFCRSAKDTALLTPVQRKREETDNLSDEALQLVMYCWVATWWDVSEYIILYMPRMVPTLSAGCAKDDPFGSSGNYIAIRRCAIFLLGQRNKSMSVVIIWVIVPEYAILCS